jgi:hypothetical protein
MFPTKGTTLRLLKERKQKGKRVTNREINKEKGKLILQKYKRQISKFLLINY